MLGAVLPLAPAASAHPTADSEVLWQIDCGLDHQGADDPIVYPNQPGKSHMHSFYGNSSTNAASTAATLLGSRSSCGRGLETSDHSGYWVPALYKTNAGGASSLVTNDDQGMFIYYRRPGGASGPKITPFPVGLRMIAGNHDATAANPNSLFVTDWDCGGGPEYTHIPQCQANYSQSLHASVEFPNCWDGKHLDSADHMSHMAYANRDSGACPASHPVSLPQVTYEVDYPYIPGGPAYELASGGQYSMHADFFAAWDPQVQNALVTACLNAGKNCIDINRDGNTLFQPAGEPGGTLGSRINLADYPSTGPQVLGDQTVAPKTPSPAPRTVAAATAVPQSQPTVLPDTGAAGLLGGLIGLAALAYGFYQYRFRRRSLLASLRKAGRSR